MDRAATLAIELRVGVDITDAARPFSVMGDAAGDIAEESFILLMFRATVCSFEGMTRRKRRKVMVFNDKKCHRPRNINERRNDAELKTRIMSARLSKFCNYVAIWRESETNDYSQNLNKRQKLNKRQNILNKRLY